MGKLIVSEFVSLDGIMEGPGPDDPFDKAGWTMPYGSEQFLKFKFAELFDSEALLLGRVTYEGFAEAWPSRTDDAGFAAKMNAMPKYVVSSTLGSANWDNTQIIAGDVARGVAELKDKTKGDILLNGSSVLLQSLIEHDLVDEYRLLVYPVIVGGGKRLFKEGTNISLELVASMAFEKGPVLLTYKSAKS